jgi:hypothetical protein
MAVAHQTVSAGSTGTRTWTDSNPNALTIDSMAAVGVVVGSIVTTTVVGRSVALPYAARSEVAGSRALPYTKIAAVGAQRAYQYSVLDTSDVASSRSLRYALTGSVGASRGLEYLVIEDLTDPVYWIGLPDA